MGQSKDQEPDAELDSADELISAARKYFYSEFSNPRREGCPAPGVVTRVAASRRLPSDDLREHLFSCSECFSEFREALSVSAPTVSAKQPWWVVITPRATPAFAVATVVLLTAAVVFLILMFRDRSQNSEVVTLNGNATHQAGGEVSEANQSAEPQPTLAIPEERSTPGLVAVRLDVDLEDYPLLRDAVGEGPTKNVIQLTATLTEMRMRLPENSPSGPYTVNIRSPELDRTYLSSTAQWSNGKAGSLQTTLDLRKLEPGRYVLCISPASQVPFCYEAGIASSRR